MGSLSDFSGMLANGTWRLQATGMSIFISFVTSKKKDTASADIGSIQDFFIEISTKSSVYFRATSVPVNILDFGSNLILKVTLSNFNMYNYSS